MGQLTASAFQAYDPDDAAGIQPGPFSLYSVDVDQILPTQMNVGQAEVGAKISGWDLLASSQLQSTLLTDIEPVVVGPDGKLYLLNGHHTFTSLEESVWGPSDPTVYINVVANYSNLTTSQFWTQMESANLLLPLDNGVPQIVDTATGAPIPTALTDLTNDPYRGLERSILKNKSSVLFPNSSNITGAPGASTPGLDKMNGFYSDFIWADAYRNANGGLGLPYLSPGDIALATQWNLNPDSTTTMPGIGTVTVAQLPGFILSHNISITSTISNLTLATGTLDGNGGFTGITSFNFGTAANPIILGTPQSGFVMQLGADKGFTVTLSGANTYTGGTTILAGTLVIANDAALGAAAPANYSIDPDNIAASVEAANGIIFNSLDEGAGTLRIGGSFSTNRPIAVDGETATIDLAGHALTLTGSIVSLGSDGDGLGDETGVSDLSVNDSGSGGKLILAPSSGGNPGFFGNWIITNGTLQVSSDAALGNTTGPAYEIGQIDLDGGIFQAGANFASVRSFFLTGGSTFDTNGFTTSFAGSLTDVQRTITIKNTSTASAGAVTFGSFDVGTTAILALSGGTKGETVTFANGIVRTDEATVFIDPSSTSSLGNTEKVFATTAPTVTNGIVAAWMITDNGGGASSNPYDFLTYGANGFVKATYTKVGSGSSGGIRVASATDVVEQTGNATLAANAQAYALKVDSGSTITATGFTLTLGDGTDPAGLILSNATIAGGTLAFGGSEAVIDVKGSSVAISSIITGSNGLTLSGSGALTVSAVSTMTGPITIDSGTLSLTVANAFANASGFTLLNVKSSPSNSILNFTADQTFKTLNATGTNGSITFSNGARFTIGDTGNLDSTVLAAITESGAAVAGALTKNGSGLLDLSGISSGKLNLVASSTIAVNDGILRVVAKEFANANTINLGSGGEVQFAENGGDVFAGNVTGNGDVRLIGGTLKLTGTGLTYSGGTFVEAGSTLLLTTANVATGNANIGDAGGDIVFDQATSGVYSGVISDAQQMGSGTLMQGTLIKDDSSGANSGNVTLTAVQDFSGFTYIEAGSLTLGAVNALEESEGVVLGRVGGGATASLVLDADNQLSSLSDNASNATSVQLNGHVLTLAPGSSGSSVYDGTISDGTAALGSVVKAGLGLVALGGANTFTGGLTIDAGTLELANAQATGTGDITFATDADATLLIDLGDVPANTIDGFTFGDGIDLAGIGFSGSGSVVLKVNNVLEVSENGHTYDLQLDPNDSFTDGYFQLASDESGTGVLITEQARPQVVSGQTLIVSGSQSSSGLLVLSGGTLEAVAGGSVGNTVILGGGQENVESGGIDEGAAVLSGGNLLVESGGYAASVTISSGGTAGARTSGAIVGAVVEGGELDALLSGFVSGAVIGSGGSLEVFFNGVASGTIISGGGAEKVFGDEFPITGDRGFDYGATILDGGLQLVQSGGIVNGAAIMSGGLEEVTSGGSVSGTVVSGGGMLEAEGGASLTSISLLAGGTLEILSGYATSGMVLIRGQILEVGTGGTATATTVGSGATQIVSGGSASSVGVQGGGNVLVLGGGVTTGDTLVGSGRTLVARETVSSGGTASGTALSNTGLLTVSSGGSAADTVVGSSGGLAVMSGGSATGAIINSGGTATLSGGTAVGAAVKSSATLSVVAGIDSAATVSNGGKIVLSGGADLDITLLNGGQEILSSGGSAGGTIVSSGGLQVVLSGAEASGSELENGGVIDISGGTDISATISSGGEVWVSLGADSGTVVFQGGLVTVLGGGHTSGSDIQAGGREVVSSGGSASVATVVAGGQVDVLSGGTASGTVLGLGGREFVAAGGVASDTQVGPDGLQIVSSGGQSIDAVLSSGGGAFVSSGGLASSMTVLSGAEFSVLKGGVAFGAILSNGGHEIVSSGGTNRSAVVNSGGEEILSAGGTASNTTVFGGGTETIGSGAAASGTALSAGEQVVERGGIANGTVVSGGEEDVSGTANGTVVSAGGSAAVSSGGQANGLVIGTGGSATVLSGGAVSGVTLSGGTLEVDSGGAVNSSTITFSGGGELILDDTKFRGKIDNFDSTDPDSIDLTHINFATMTLGYTGNTTSGTLSVGDGSHTMKLAMIGDYTLANFQAATDGLGGTLITVSGVLGH